MVKEMAIQCKWKVKLGKILHGGGGGGCRLRSNNRVSSAMVNETEAVESGTPPSSNDRACGCSDCGVINTGVTARGNSLTDTSIRTHLYPHSRRPSLPRRLMLLGSNHL